MRIDILTLFPEIFQGFLKSSILGRAIDQGFIYVNLVNIRDYAMDKHRTCDDYTYGGGPGMVLKPEPLVEALKTVQTAKSTQKIIYLSPSGRLLNQSIGEKLAVEEEVVLICGRYEGIDQRIIDIFITDEISIGDYILSGGEVAAMVLVDTVARLIKGVIKEDSLAEESFRRGPLEYPQYTRPYDFQGRKVPEVLLSGHHAEIERWRLRKSIEKTLQYRSELLDLRKKKLSPDIMVLLEEVRKRGRRNG